MLHFFICTGRNIAEHAGYSAFHLTREFKAATGSTLMEYVREERIHAAAREIAAGINICEAAMNYCFDTHAGFTKAFTAVYGCTPKDYKAYAQKQKTNKVYW